MKFVLRSLAAIIVIVAVYAVAAVYVPAVRIAPICAPAEAFLINRGLIKPKDADWGYLKLRSGKDGLKALETLKRHGASDDVRVAAAAVLSGYHGAGRFTSGEVTELDAFKAETKFSELALLDGKATPAVLQPGQALPSDLMDDIRFDIAQCDPRSGRFQVACHIHLRDADGDGKLEAIASYWVRGEVYARGPSGWAYAALANVCQEDEAALARGAFTMQARHFDDIVAGGHRIPIVTGDCGHFLGTDTWARQVAAARPFAGGMKTIPVLSPTGGTLPMSLISDVTHGTIIPDRLSGSAMSYHVDGDATMRPYTAQVSASYIEVPGCITLDYDSHCLAVLIDLDHDRRDEVVLISTGFTTGYTDFRQMTVFAFDGSHWHIAGSGAMCKEWGLDPVKAGYTSARPRWMDMLINDHAIPLEASGCVFNPNVVY